MATSNWRAAARGKFWALIGCDARIAAFIVAASIAALLAALLAAGALASGAVAAPAVDDMLACATFNAASLWCVATVVAAAGRAPMSAERSLAEGAGAVATVCVDAPLALLLLTALLVVLLAIVPAALLAACAVLALLRPALVAAAPGTALDARLAAAGA